MMEDPKIKMIGPTSKSQGPYKFYKGFKYTYEGKDRIISLGQFFFMKILDDMPICIGELQLAWEDKNCPNELASVKLYFVPEDTPEGRMPNHGQDEILAYSEKMTLKLEDLVTLIVHNVTWIEGRKGIPDETLMPDNEYKDLGDSFKMNSYGLSYKDIEKEVEKAGPPNPEETEIIIMTYPRYCRYRCVLKRLENCTEKWLKYALVCAIGGFSAKSSNNRIYFCRDIFDHPDLDEFELRCEHLAPSLKARDKRRKSWKRENSSEVSEESNSSSAATTPTKPGPPKPASVKPLHVKPLPIVKPASIKPAPIVKPPLVKPAPMIKPSPNKPVLTKPALSKPVAIQPAPVAAPLKVDQHSAKLGKRATPLRNGIRLDKMKVSKDEQAFLIELHKYMKSRNTPIGRIPSLGFKQIDLYQFYRMADRIGGYEAVTTKRLWKFLFDQLGGNAGNTSAATCTRRHYEKLLLPYEKWKKGDELQPVAKKRKKQKLLKVPFRNELDNKPPSAENENLKPDVKNEPTELKEEVPVVKEAVKPEKVKVKSEEIGRKEEIQNRALIIKQELENMKIRKDAKRLLLQKEKIWEDRRKCKLNEKGRKPSGGQKTVRELLDQTLKAEDQNEKTGENVIMKNTKNDETLDTSNVHGEIKEKLTSSANVISQTLVSGVNSQISTSKAIPQNVISPVSLPRPMFYPQLLPMGGPVRGMQPVRFPFMIPQLGVPGIPAAMQPIHPLMSPVSKDNKPLHELSRLVTEQKEIIDIPSAIDKTLMGQIKHRPSSVAPSSAPPPSNHMQIPKGPITSATSRQKGPVGPAHSNGLKRQNPFSDPNKNTTHFPGLQLKSAKGNSSKTGTESDLKRQKMAVSPELNVFKPGSGLGEMPVLDLSMKTLRAQEEKQRRGESLLFSTCFSKDNRKNPNKDTFDAPQDLSMKSTSSSSHSQSSSTKSTSSSVNSSKHIPLNVPLHPTQSEVRLSTSGDTTVPSKSATADRLTSQDGRKEKSSLGNVPPFSVGIMPPGLGGLPLDFASAFIHPAFPTPMMMQPGAFPTPVQLQQMIQGQVAASFPLLRPEAMQNPIQLFQPAFAVSSSSVGINNSVRTESKR